MKNRKDYLTATQGNGQDQLEASTRLIQNWLRQINTMPTPTSVLFGNGDPLALLYVMERIAAVAGGEPFIKKNAGPPKQAFRNHEIHKDIERQRSTGESLDLSIRRTTENLAEGLSGMDREVLSERSIKNIHERGSSMTREEWEDWIITRFRELGQTVVDDRTK